MSIEFSEETYMGMDKKGKFHKQNDLIFSKRSTRRGKRGG
jgi:hypothetical protein